MKGFFRFSMIMMAAPLLCGAALVIGYVMLVVMTIPQLPEWAQPGVEQWLFDIPQYAETSDNGSIGDSSPAPCHAGTERAVAEGGPWLHRAPIDRRAGGHCDRFESARPYPHTRRNLGC